MAHDEKLEEFFLAEAMMMMELRRQGHRFFCESEVVSWHFDASRLEAIRKGYPAIGHVLAAQRSSSWPAWRRFLYGLAFPLIGVLRWQRAITAFFRTRQWTGFSPLSLVLAGGVAALWCVNEWRGFWFGAGDSPQALSDFEHNRKLHLRAREWPHPQRPGGMSREEFQRRTGVQKV